MKTHKIHFSDILWPNGTFFKVLAYVNFYCGCTTLYANIEYLNDIDIMVVELRSNREIEMILNQFNC